MDKEKLKQDYKSSKGEYTNLQKEACDFVNKLTKKHEKVIHVAKIDERPNNKIKSLESIQNNSANSCKYKKYKSLFDIKDIAGIRVICHCEDDVENLAVLFQGELRQRQHYSNIERKDIGGRGIEYPYNAVHINFSKTVTIESKTIDIICEIQIRTVMADAWAVQNHKYLYKKVGKGEAHELTSAVSEIMTGCEKLWSLVKKKSLQEKEIDISEEISKIHEKAEKETMLAKQTKDQIKTINDWFRINKKIAFEGRNKLGIKTFMEVITKLPQLNLNIDKKVLRDSAQKSTIRTFGWPIGVFLDNRKEYAPKVDLNSIHAEISIKEQDWFNSQKERISYDYWAIHQSASFYLLKSLFEDQRKPTHIFFNTRIVRITEVLKYINNLYSFLNVPTNSQIEIFIKHGGLKGRVLNSSTWNRELFRDYKTNTDEVPTTILTSLKEIESDIVNAVEKFTKPLFEQFEFFKLDKKVLEDIVINYINGKVV
jgi:ppGpp synthetase/RelA/SpoT-type nucleotidyltranferase